MHLSSASLSIAAMFAALAHGQSINSAPFSLHVISDDAKFNGGILYGCHQGALYEGLCFSSNKTASTSDFAFAHSESSPSFGNLVYNLAIPNGGSTNNIWTPVKLGYDISTNVAVAYINPDPTGPQTWSFNDNDRMLLASRFNLDQPGPPGPELKTYSRWAICENYPAGLSPYVSLSWVLGNGKPQNPTKCSDVEIQRVFAN